jgi:hypothetical protein
VEFDDLFLSGAFPDKRWFALDTTNREGGSPSHRRRNVKRVLFLGLLVLLSSCKKDSAPTEPQSNAGEILPLKVGNQWIGRVTDLDSPGHPSHLDTMVVAKDTVIQNEKWFFLTGWSLYVANRTDGLWALDNSQTWLLWKFPAVEGESYRRLFDTVTVVSTNAIVSVPAGTYRCYQYHVEGSDYNEYLSPDVGPIKMGPYIVTTESGPEVYHVTWELFRAIKN